MPVKKIIQNSKTVKNSCISRVTKGEEKYIYKYIVNFQNTHIVVDDCWQAEGEAEA